MKRKLRCALFMLSLLAGISACSKQHAQTDDRQQVQGAQQDLQEQGVQETGGGEGKQIPVKPVKKEINKNRMLNASFEKNDISMWKLHYKGDFNPTDIRKQEADAKSGAYSFHFESDKKQNFKIEQKVYGLEAGTYSVLANIQGENMNSNAKVYLYARVNGKTIRSKLVKLSGWGKWKKPKIQGLVLDKKTNITIGVKVKCKGGGRGTIDDFVLEKID